jgi:hypothetical protein
VDFVENLDACCIYFDGTTRGADDIMLAEQATKHRVVNGVGFIVQKNGVCPVNRRKGTAPGAALIMQNNILTATFMQPVDLFNSIRI